MKIIKAHNKSLFCKFDFFNQHCYPVTVISGLIMTDKKAVRIFIFSFTVMMLLLRPYAAYKISSRADVAANPVKVNELLQRLIKKKDEHHSLSESDIIAVQPTKITIALPAIILLSLHRLFAFVFAKRQCIGYADIAFHILPHDKHYLLLSRLQI